MVRMKVIEARIYFKAFISIYTQQELCLSLALSEIARCQNYFGLLVNLINLSLTSTVQIFSSDSRKKRAGNVYILLPGCSTSIIEGEF